MNAGFWYPPFTLKGCLDDFLKIIFFRIELRLISSLFNQGLNLTIYLCHGSLFNSFILLNHVHFMQLLQLIVFFLPFEIFD